MTEGNRTMVTIRDHGHTKVLTMVNETNERRYVRILSGGELDTALTDAINALWVTENEAEREAEE